MLIYLKNFTKEENISQYFIISMFQRTIKIINCAQEGVKNYVWKLCLNLCSRKWLRPRCSLVRYLIPLQLLQLNTLFWDGLINFTKFRLLHLLPFLQNANSVNTSTCFGYLRNSCKNISKTGTTFIIIQIFFFLDIYR